MSTATKQYMKSLRRVNRRCSVVANGKRCGSVATAASGYSLCLAHQRQRERQRAVTP